MKIFVNINHGADQSYLLILRKGITEREVRGIIKEGYDKAVYGLMAKSQKSIEVYPRDRRKFRDLADFVLTDGYTSERLA